MFFPKSLQKKKNIYISFPLFYSMSPTPNFSFDTKLSPPPCPIILLGLKFKLLLKFCIKIFCFGGTLQFFFEKYLMFSFSTIANVRYRDFQVEWQKFPKQLFGSLYAIPARIPLPSSHHAK